MTIRVCLRCFSLDHKTSGCYFCFTGEGGNYPTMDRDELLGSIQTWESNFQQNWPTKEIAARTLLRREKAFDALPKKQEAELIF